MRPPTTLDLVAKGGKKRKAAAGDVATNRYAAYRYDLLDKLECGVVLQGTEVKSLRNGSATLKDGYANIRAGEPREPRARAPAQAARPSPRDRAPHRPDQRARAHARPDADLLLRRAGQGRDRARPRQGPLRQAGGDQGARPAPRRRARVARRRALSVP